MPQLTEAVERLLAAYRQPTIESFSPDTPRIKLSEVVSRFAFIYEKIRNAIDFKEEHLLRRNAIERILRRQLIIENRGTVDSRRLIYELIRARYLPNSKLPETRVPELQAVIDKYLLLLATLPHVDDPKLGREHVRWVLSVASSDLEEHLVPSTRPDGLVECMAKVFNDLVVVPEGTMDERERSIQLYLAIHRSLIKSDLAVLRYHLFFLEEPGWRQPSPEEIRRVAENLPELSRRVEGHINHPWSDRLFRFVKKYATTLRVLQDVFQANDRRIDELLADPAQLEEAVRQSASARYRVVRQKRTRTAVRAIIYIFLTKIILAFVVELPYDKLVLQEVRLVPLYINTVFHPLLMFFIALTVRLPGARNTDRIVQGVREIVYAGTRRVIFTRLEKPLTRGGVLDAVFTIFYALTAIITFGAIIWFLSKLQFNIVSGFLFIFFLSVVSFFGLKVRQTARELVVVEPRESIIVTVIDFFSLPVLRLGRWISLKAPKINVFIFFLDFIIEAPFKSLLEVTDQWLSFVREKKEEIT